MFYNPSLRAVTEVYAMASNNDFSSVLYEALVETLNTMDKQVRETAARPSPKRERRTIRFDLHGVTIERMALEVTRR